MIFEAWNRRARLAATVLALCAGCATGKAKPGVDVGKQVARGCPPERAQDGEVRLVFLGDSVTVGTPTVDGATVSATVMGDATGPKLVIFKFKQKVKYRRHTGHRQHLTRVRIDDIATGSRRAKAQTAEPEAAPEPAKAEAAEKPKRTRKPAAKAASAPRSPAKKADADEKPKAAPRRRTTKTAESED